MQERQWLGIDALGGLVAGALVLALAPRLSAWEGLPIAWLRCMACANLLYGGYSGMLWLRAEVGRSAPRAALRTLVVANGAWALLCAWAAWRTFHDARPLGTLHLCLESLIVGTLSLVERKVFAVRGAVSRESGMTGEKPAR